MPNIKIYRVGAMVGFNNLFIPAECVLINIKNGVFSFENPNTRDTIIPNLYLPTEIQKNTNVFCISLLEATDYILQIVNEALKEMNATFISENTNNHNTDNNTAPNNQNINVVLPNSFYQQAEDNLNILEKIESNTILDNEKLQKLSYKTIDFLLNHNEKNNEKEFNLGIQYDMFQLHISALNNGSKLEVTQSAYTNSHNLVEYPVLMFDSFGNECKEILTTGIYFGYQNLEYVFVKVKEIDSLITTFTQHTIIFQDKEIQLPNNYYEENTNVTKVIQFPKEIIWQKKINRKTNLSLSISQIPVGCVIQLQGSNDAEEYYPIVVKNSKNIFLEEISNKDLVSVEVVCMYIRVQVLAGGLSQVINLKPILFYE